MHHVNGRCVLPRRAARLEDSSAGARGRAGETAAATDLWEEFAGLSGPAGHQHVISTKQP